MPKCVYCLEDFTDSALTVDHVIARSWFTPDAKELAKWKAPSCEPCNNRFSKDEKDLMERLALCLDPASPQYSEIAAKVKRAMNPRAATLPKDAMHRFNRRAKVLGAVKENLSPGHLGLLPGFEENIAAGSTTGVLVLAGALQSIVKKWIHGLYFCEISKPIPAEAEVDAYFVSDDAANQAFGEILQHGRRLVRGSGFKTIIWHVEEEGKLGTLFAFLIWEQLRAYGSVTAG